MTHTPADFALLSVALRVHRTEEPFNNYSPLWTTLYYNLDVILAALDIASGVKP